MTKKLCAPSLVGYGLFVCMLLVTHGAVSGAATIYKQIQWLNQMSVLWQEEEWPNESFYDYLNRCFDYQKHMQEAKKRRIVFKLFDEVTAAQGTPCTHNCLYDTSTMQDLNLLAGKSPQEPYIGELIDRTKTQFGKVFLYGLISNPTHDIDLLQRRQATIKLLVDDEALYASLTEITQTCAASENLLISLWGQESFLQPTKRRYFNIPFLTGINEGCNTSIALLETKSVLNHYERAMFLGTGLVASVLLPIHGMSKLAGTALPDYLNRTAERLQGASSKILAFLAGISTKNLFAASISLVAGGVCVLGLKEEYEWLRDNAVLDMLLHEKMGHIASFLNQIPRIAQLVAAHPQLRVLCPGASKIDAFVRTEAHTRELERLFALCRSSTLNTKPSLFSVHARVLLAFKLIYALKKTVEPVLLAIGELDAYLSCAQLYKEFQHKPVHFCFTQYNVGAVPRVTMIDFWNPFIDPYKAVPNSLELAGPTGRNMVITGPNAGGKSTIIKAVPINLILAQSIGMAAARSAEITPFYSIATYLNIVDDTAAGNSLFKAQVLRAQAMITLVEQTPANQFSFVALDEMFNGTSARESMAAAYSVVDHIGAFDNNISIIATHFPLLTRLGKEGSAFENYKVSVEVDDAHGIHYPFKLERGISNQHIALDILRQEGYDYGIIQAATKVLKTGDV